MSDARHPLDPGVPVLRSAALARDMERVLREDSEQVPDLTRTWQGRADGHEAKARWRVDLDRLIGLALWGVMGLAVLALICLGLWWIGSAFAEAARVQADWAEILLRAAG